MNYVTNSPIKYRNVTSAFVNASSLGATQILAGVTGRSIRVVACAIVCTSASTVKFQSNTTDITATFPLGANGGFVLPYNDWGWCETLPGEALNINLGTANATGVHIDYILL